MLDLIDLLRQEVGTLSSDLDWAAPPQFDGAGAFTSRVLKGASESLDDLDKVKSQAKTLNPNDPGFKPGLIGTAIGASFAVVPLALSLIDADAVKAAKDEHPNQPLSVKQVAELSPGYLGFLTEANKTPECGPVLDGSQAQVAQLLGHK